MKIRYLKLPDAHSPGSYSWYPLLQVCMRYARKGRVFHALVDSGAIDCIFPESLGRLLGIDVTSGKHLRLTTALANKRRRALCIQSICKLLD